jgi:hypothetical protein
MKKLVILTAALAGLTQLCSAAPVCGSASLSSYIGLGSSGCMIGTNTLSDFQLISGTTGATEISPLNVLLTPLGGSSGPSLVTTVNVTAASGSILESLFTFRVAGNSYVGSSITLSGGSETGDGAVTAVENFCAGGGFGPDGVSGCSGNAGALVAVDGIQNQDAAAFNAVSLLSVTNDLTFDAGLAGSAAGGTLVNQFTTASAAVPEPATLLLALIGLLFAAGWRRKAFHAGLLKG